MPDPHGIRVDDVSKAANNLRGVGSFEGLTLRRMIRANKCHECATRVLDLGVGSGGNYAEDVNLVMEGDAQRLDEIVVEAVDAAMLRSPGCR